MDKRDKFFFNQVERESKVEGKIKTFVEKAGGIAYKFISPGTSGVPDRIVLLPIPEEHQSIVAKYISFIEVKRPGGKTTKNQDAQINRILNLGFRVTVMDNFDGKI
jgi:hypothetical protein